MTKRLATQGSLTQVERHLDMEHTRPATLIMSATNKPQKPGALQKGHTTMATTLITPSITSLYSHTETDPLDLTQLAGRHANHINLDTAKHAYRDAMEEALQHYRPDWFLALDGSVTGPHNSQPLTPDEAEDLAWEIDAIDTATILQEATK